MESEAYTKDEMSNIFDVVNSNHLHLKGKVRSDLRRQFLSWKQNKTIGAFDLFIKLYESEDVYDKRIEFWKKYIEDQGPFWDNAVTKKPIPFYKHQLYMSYKDEEIEVLEKKLEDVEEGKGYMSEESHGDLIEALKNEKEEVIQEQGSTIAKLRYENNCLREKYEISERRFEASKKYYEDTISKVCAMD